MLQLQLVLAEPVAGADGVDRDADLHAEAGRERKDIEEGGGAERALARDRRGGLGAATATDRPVGEAERQAEATADPAGEGRHGQLTLTGGDRLDQPAQLTGAIPEVPVTEQEDRCGATGSVGYCLLYTSPSPRDR